jgi:hypothetical protein
MIPHAELRPTRHHQNSDTIIPFSTHELQTVLSTVHRINPLLVSAPEGPLVEDPSNRL